MDVILLIQSTTLLQVVTMRFCCQRFLRDSRATFALVFQNISPLRCGVFSSKTFVFLWLQIALNIVTTILQKKCTEIFLNSFENLYKDYNMAFWPRCPQYLRNEDFYTQAHCGGLRRIDDKLEEQIFDAHKAPWEKRKMNSHFFCLTLPIVLCVNL